MQLDLKYDGPNKFHGIGKHFEETNQFEIIEGEVNKKTKYWKFIAVYDGSNRRGGKKSKDDGKDYVQVESTYDKACV